ncbi:MAG: hypothetical protein LBM02_08165 [Lachnospiraceae bacterium]|jgi:hypothetical protein|nr:hypothetical protein [Lachnospiraceae bacterium]
MELILNKKELAINLLQNARNELINKRASSFELSMNQIESLVIDNLVESKLKDNPEKYDESAIRSQVEKLYYTQLQPHYEKLMKETSNPISKITVQNNLKDKVFEASDRTMEAINGNRDFIKNAMDKTISYDSSFKKQLLKEYEKLTGAKPVASRQNIFNEAGKAVGSKYVGKNGEPFYFKPVTGTPELSYRQIGRIAYNNERNAIESVKMEKARLKNEERISQGRDPLYIAKEWNWSGLANTRHSGMDGQVVALEEPFIVTNEITGDVDEMQHPQDGNGSAANEINCGCGYTLLTKLMVEDRGLDPNDYYDYGSKNNLEEIKVEEINPPFSGAGFEKMETHNFKDVTIRMSPDAKYTNIKEIKSTYDNLPIGAKKSVNNIYVSNKTKGGGLVFGEANISNGDIILYNSHRNYDVKRTLHHEIGHSLDIRGFDNNEAIGVYRLKISSSKEYHKAYLTDKRYNKKIEKETGENRPYFTSPITNKDNPDYAMDEYKKYYKNKNNMKDAKYKEDFADGVAGYLDNKKTFESFFPNRAKIIERAMNGW